MPSEDLTTRTAQEQIAAPPPLVIPESDTLGPVMVQELSMTQYYGGSHLARNSAMIPHVTHHDKADITDLELYREGLEAPMTVSTGASWCHCRSAMITACSTARMRHAF